MNNLPLIAGLAIQAGIVLYAVMTVMRAVIKSQ